LVMTPLIGGGDVVVALGDRILGRVVATDVHKPGSEGDIVVPAGTLIDEAWVAKIEAEGVDEILVRSAITCESRVGICSSCYGRDLGRGHQVNVGEAVGVIAAQSIGEPGTQLTMRTFDIGGAASRASAAASVQEKNNGIVRLQKMKTVTSDNDNRGGVSRSGASSIADVYGRASELYKLAYSAVISVQD